MTLPEIAGQKQELIAAIGRLNPGATPAFLSAFTPDALGRYLDRLERVVTVENPAEAEGVGPASTRAEAA